MSVRILEEDVVCLLGNFCVACEWFQMLGQNQIISPFRKFENYACVPKKKGDVMSHAPATARCAIAACSRGRQSGGEEPMLV